MRYLMHQWYVDMLCNTNILSKAHESTHNFISNTIDLLPLYTTWRLYKHPIHRTDAYCFVRSVSSSHDSSR